MKRSLREPWSAMAATLAAITESGSRIGQRRGRAAAIATAASPAPSHADSVTRLRAQSATIGTRSAAPRIQARSQNVERSTTDANPAGVEASPHARSGCARARSGR